MDRIQAKQFRIHKTKFVCKSHLLIGVLSRDEKHHLLPVVLHNGLGELQGQVISPTTKGWTRGTDFTDSFLEIFLLPMGATVTVLGGRGVVRSGLGVEGQGREDGDTYIWATFYLPAQVKHPNLQLIMCSTYEIVSSAILWHLLHMASPQ